MGIFNGFLVAVMNLPPFIATLCSMMITRGLGSLVTGGLSVAWPASSTPEGAFRNLFKLNVGGTIIPVGLIFVLAAAVLMSIFLNKTRPGRYIIAVGSNKEALASFRGQRSKMAVAGICDLRHLYRTGGSCLCGSTFLFCSSGWRSRFGDGCHLRSDHRRNFHEWRSWYNLRNTSRCICYGTVKDRTSVRRVPSEWSADHHRTCTDLGSIYRRIEK